MKKNKSNKFKIIAAVCIVLSLTVIIAAVVLTQNDSQKTSDGKNAATEGSASEKKKDQTVEKSEENDEETTESGKSADAEQVLIERVEASYEEWLASAALIGMTMQYPDFEQEEIYLASETELDDHSKSKGVYIIFESEGEKIALSVQPLDEERSEAGTNDLYTSDLGYATFDEIKAKDVKTKKMTKVEVDDLTEEIEQSILVTIYSH